MAVSNLRFLLLTSSAVGLSAIAAAPSSLKYSDLHDFGGIVRNASNASLRDGGPPGAAVIFDSVGNMYGTTAGGGLYGYGNIWKLTPAGKYTDIHDFGGKVKRANGNMGPDGTGGGSVLIDKNGNLYGCAGTGGYYGRDGSSSSSMGFGILWKLTQKGTYTDIHDFGNIAETTAGTFVADGVGPSGLAIDANGNLFGAAGFGGLYNRGMAFQLSSNGTYTDVHDFGGLTTYIGTKPIYDGIQPLGVVLDSSGNLFGVTWVGGLYGGPGGPQGIVWEITASGKYQNLHDFGGMVSSVGGSTTRDGGDPEGTPSLDKGGNLYGTTPGTVWKLSTTGTYSLLYEFTNQNDGIDAHGGVIVDSNGNLFGTTSSGGLNGKGVVFELSSTGVYKDLHDFGGYTKFGAVKKLNPSYPQTGLTFDHAGHIYGSTSQGGANVSPISDGGSLFILK